MNTGMLSGDNDFANNIVHVCAINGYHAIGLYRLGVEPLRFFHDADDVVVSDPGSATGLQHRFEDR
jgi:hypothetical protein